MTSRYHNEFEELRPLGSGSFSTVFEAKPINDQTLYAIKKIPFKREDLGKTSIEINILRSLNSEFVVQYIDSWIEDNYYIGTFNPETIGTDAISSHILLYSQYNLLLLHVQMELCSLPLSTFIAKLDKTLLNRMSIEGYISSCEVFVQLVEGINYLHEKRIIHRDIKPENIMLKTEQNSISVKITDFGLSTYHTFVDESHTKNIGTKRYRAPEVDTDGKRYTTKADIYSLGIIMQQMFNFDYDSDLNENEFEIQSKYENAKEISLKCVSFITSRRPDCYQILTDKYLWNYVIQNDEIEKRYNNNKRYVRNTVWPLITHTNFDQLNNCNTSVTHTQLLDNQNIFAKNRNINALIVSEHIDSTPQEPVIINEFLYEEIQSIVCGYCHLLILTKCKRIYSFGHNECGQLGNGSIECIYRPTIIEPLKNELIVDIKCGEYLSLALSECGRVYAWGFGQYGQIGNCENKNQFTPTQIECLGSIKITSISCGAHHCLALSSTGELYGWGDNDFGQLGVENESDLSGYRNKPIIIETGITIIKISCGYSFSLILTSDHDIYSFGHNLYGQLGIGNTTNQFEMSKTQTSVKFTDIYTMWCDNISAGLSVTGKYYVWGKCGDLVVTKPGETYYRSFDEIFDKYSNFKFTVEQIKLD